MRQSLGSDRWIQVRVGLIGRQMAVTTKAQCNTETIGCQIRRGDKEWNVNPGLAKGKKEEGERKQRTNAWIGRNRGFNKEADMLSYDNNPICFHFQEKQNL